LELLQVPFGALFLRWTGAQTMSFNPRGSPQFKLTFSATAGNSLTEAVIQSLSSPTFKTARKASWGISTRPMRFIRFLPAFCFSSSLRLREMSPP